MEKRDFFRLEEECRLRFSELGQCYHVCTQENHPVIFHNDEEFAAAMNAVALATMLYPDLTLVTFEVMSNHFHFAIAGDKARIEPWFKKIIRLLIGNPIFELSKGHLVSLSVNIHPTKDLEHFRNVIAYVNRNGYVVCPDETPFTYRWGANRFYYNPDARKYYEICHKSISYRTKRTVFHSNLAKDMTGLAMQEGYVSPLCFCDIETGERLFRNARHYFVSVSKAVESSISIAKEIGETVFYTDDEIFTVVATKSIREYNVSNPVLLQSGAKVAMAKMMHYDYNASNKQISRILKMEIDAVKSLFPMSH